ncbi:hypothetical protein DPMN_058809 [Dreissena polymorpha]|uniref:Uncharacterized protein n=1 Tax=Dreissena polymorpha TaxID=45954 RepID=A0A9D4C2T1_DREPO|nr:hypothetical protein DPMN_058809 [Dreissena polymorpha]
MWLEVAVEKTVGATEEARRLFRILGMGSPSVVSKAGLALLVLICLACLPVAGTPSQDN